MCHEDPVIDYSNTEIMDKVKQICQNAYQTNSRHSPLLIYGTHGSGKTSLLKSIYRQSESWFGNSRVLRLVRFASATPRSSYNLELLRIICQQICIALRLPEGFLPKDASFDPLYVNNWFQNLIRLFESLNQTLVIFIDDLHLINPLDSDVVAALNWIPLSLPDNVYLICTTGINPEQLRLTLVQRERLRNPDSYVELPPGPYLKGMEIIHFTRMFFYQTEYLCENIKRCCCTEREAEAIKCINEVHEHFSNIFFIYS